MAEEPIDNKAPAPKEEEGNLYTNIFEKKDEAQEADTSQIIEGVDTRKEKEAKPDKKILGDIPELEKKIVGAFDPTKRNLKIVRFIFFFLVALALIATGFFYTELNVNFDLLSDARGANTAQQLDNSSQDIITIQTSINQKNYLLMSSYLQELSYLSDTYAKARQGGVTDEDLTEMQNQILLAFENAQSKFREPTKAGTIDNEEFQKALKNALKEEVKVLKSETLTTAILQEISVYSSALQLVNNKELSAFFNNNTDDIRSEMEKDDAKLFALTQKALSILKNDFSSVTLIKQSRIAWSVIVQEIEKITKGIDNLYNTGFYNELGGIKYTAFDFDFRTNRITLIGEVKRDDGTTFTLVANLLDAIEQSLLFSEVDNRAFPKTGSDEEGYKSTFRIEAQLSEDYLTLN